MRVGLDEAVAGKMLAAVGHAALQQTVHQAFGQQADHARVAAKGAVANHTAFAKIKVEHRREAEINAAGAQFGTQHITASGGGVGRGHLVVDPLRAQGAHRRQVRQAVGAKTLHPAAFMIDADQQVITQGLDLGAQLAELLAVFPVAGEQDDAAGQRVLEAAAIVLAEFETGDVDDEGGVLGHGVVLEVTMK